MTDTLNRVDNAETFVALDLETTGLNSDTDTIIEVGAVKFTGNEILDTFHTLVNPLCPIPSFVARLTGINQSEVDQAPVFSAVSDSLVEFVGTSGLIGHNVKFDADFLIKHGIKLTNECYDTWDLASMLLPFAPDYSLATLAELFGVDHSKPHRALPDAEATFGVFCCLLKLMRNLDASWLVRINRLAKRAKWPIHALIESAQRESLASPDIEPLGLDFERLAERLTKTGKVPERVTPEVNHELANLVDNLQANTDFAKSFHGFEVRPQQKAMMRAVANAFDSRQHLVVEGGTGVGKSMAYLVPSIVNAVTCGTRVVISTNTINLQEQLLNNDIPSITKALEDANIIPRGILRAAPLKGKTNYLCVRRWQQTVRSENISADDVRVIGKTLNWIHETATGDKSEINLSGRDIITWNRISAGDKGQCPGLKGSSPCFLKSARNAAEGAHIVVVNHALLLADLVLGGGLLPEYDHLVIDEAHHLEEQSTRQLGISMSEQQISELLGNIERTLGLLDATTRQLGRELTGLEHSIGLINNLRTTWMPRVKTLSNIFWDSIHSFLSDHQTTLSEQQMLISNTSRIQPGWSTVEVSCENLNVGMNEGANRIGELSQLLEAMSTENREELTDVIFGLNSACEEIYSLIVNLEQVVLKPMDAKRIDWIEKGSDRSLGSNSRNNFVLNSAPLNVGTELAKLLFSKKASVVLTSATLTADGTFDYIKDRLGIGECEELQVDSPFDYGQSALLVAPEGIPLPGEPGYSASISKVITELAIKLDGHVMVLFTSHAALRATADFVRGPLGIHNVGVLAQGIDGSARQIVRKFYSNPKNILLGTSSLWEGVDLPGDQLTVLVLARLPFNVPTDPIFVARSTEYDDPFKDYALPQVILRLRQGIGRLIRRLTDRGAILVLDRRLTTRSYSKAIIGSLPPCKFVEPSISEVPTLISRWLDNENNRLVDPI